MGDHSTTNQVVSAATTACISCRRRHLKCDFELPNCTRCVKDDQECVYVVSRRGQRLLRQHGGVSTAGVRRRGTTPVRHNASVGLVESSAIKGFSPAALTSGSLDHEFANAFEAVSSGSSATPYTNPALGLTPPVSITSSHTPPDALFVPDQDDSATAARNVGRNIDLYYRHFHKSHPFLLPRAFVTLSAWPLYLQQAVALAGSSYDKSRALYECGQSIDAMLDHCHDATIYLVQAYLLRAIFKHASARARCARESLAKAIEIAREVGLDSEWYAESQSNPVLAESARRTWWELFIIDGLFAGFHHEPAFSTNEPPGSILLPCDDGAYEAGRPTAPTMSFPQLRRRFIVDDPCISSYALRIEAISTLGRVLSANQETTLQCPDTLSGLDALLATWASVLPDSKKQPLISDPLLFQSHMTIHMAAIYLHLPRSGIFSFHSATDVACAKANELLPPFLTPELHVARALKAACALSTLASLDVSGQAPHTPFFVCALVLVAIVQMSHMALGGPEWHLDRLSQVFGLLKSRAKVWRLAANVHAQLRTIALAAEQAQTEDVGQPEFEELLADMWWSDTMCYNWDRMEVMQTP